MQLDSTETSHSPLSQSYLALARKWRPAQFSDIVGQQAVVRTLMNAIKTGRVHPAYLMTGSRGIGKTSIARILAKAIRCQNASWQSGHSADGLPTEWLKSCGTCSSCTEIANGTSVDVIEIDGASNNGVDAVREIRDAAKYLPSSGSKKIYIIDEVHMLTTAAFNALLKTIEEPPPHVLFFFATTEPHKIPSTILSRCQRFDLKRVTLPQIESRLSYVLTQEKIEFESGVTSVIARAAEGSMRDALSLLDQVIAYAGGKISVSSTRESVGLIEGQTLLSLLESILARSPAAALELAQQAHQRGHDLRVLLRSLLELFHALLLIKVGADLPSAIAEEEKPELKRLSELRPIEDVEILFEMLHQGLDWIARSPQPKIVFDVLLIKCAAAEGWVSLDSAGSTGSSGPMGQTKPGIAQAGRPAPISRPHSAQAVQVAPVIAATAPMAAVVAPDAPTIQATPAGITTGSRSFEDWVDRIRKARPLLASLLEHAAVEKMPTEENPTLLLVFKTEDGYYREQLAAKSYSDQLLVLARDYFGAKTFVKLESRAEVESMAQKKAILEQKRLDSARSQVMNHPVIQEAKALFGGDLGPIEWNSDGSKNGSDS